MLVLDDELYFNKMYLSKKNGQENHAVRGALSGKFVSKMFD